MAKSLRSKIKRRWRKLKRTHLSTIIQRPNLQNLRSKLQLSKAGLEYRQKIPKNADLYPQDVTAQFPQYKPQPIIDLRSTQIQGSGLEWSGNKNKKKNKNSTIVVINKQKCSEEEQRGMDEQPLRIEKKYLKKKTRISKLRKTMVF